MTIDFRPPSQTCKSDTKWSVFRFKTMIMSGSWTSLKPSFDSHHVLPVNRNSEWKIMPAQEPADPLSSSFLVIPLMFMAFLSKTLSIESTFIQWR